MRVLLALTTAVVAALGSVGLVHAHDEAVVGPSALTIEIGTALDPATAHLATGDIVEWVNTDDERHRMRSTSGPARFDSGNLEPGESFRLRVAAGTYAYRDHRDRDQTAYHGRLVVAAGSGTATGDGSVPGGDETPPATQVSVTIADRAFAPGEIEVAAGGTVDWVNRDDRPHTVTSGDGTFGSDTLGPGATFTTSFPTAGSFAYLCAIHPEMTGTVRVLAVAAAATGADGAVPALAAPVDLPAALAPAVPPASASSAPATPAVASSLAASDLGGVGRWLLVAIIVTLSVVLFARTIRGSVRSG